MTLTSITITTKVHIIKKPSEVLKRKLMIHKTSEVYKRTPIIN
jgi:hypothetical protein